MANFVDGIAMVLPWAGGLVPATMTYNNLVITGIEPWQAGVVAAVVEGLGFVAVTTVIDIYEDKQGAGPAPLRIAMGGAGLYLAAVLIINTFLDPQATMAKMAVGAILSTFGVLGGVMVALRNQLGKRREAVALAESRRRQADADAAEQSRVERERAETFRAEQERQVLEFQRAMQADELRMRHELEMKRQEAESARKMEKVRAVKAHSAVDVPAVPEGAAQSEAVRKMVRCSEPGCGMEYAAVGGKGGHYKKWHMPELRQEVPG